MKRFIEGEIRGQGTLLPEHLDDYMAEDNPVRVVDVFVDELDLARMGFARVVPAKTGRPAYHRAVLLELYIYGCLNRIQSSPTASSSPRNSTLHDESVAHPELPPCAMSAILCTSG